MLKLLIVDGDLFQGAQMLKVLQAAGFEAAWVRTEADAWSQTAGDGHHLLVVDVDTFAPAPQSIARRLRQGGCTAPLMALTTDARIEHRLALLDDGADDCLIKPVHLQELLTRVRVLVRRAFAAEAQGWQCGCLRFLPLENRVEMAGSSVQLTPKEFALLRELAFGKGRVVPRRVILDRLYGFNDKPTDAAIEYLVHKLRQKIGGDRIRTVATVGYALNT